MAHVVRSGSTLRVHSEKRMYDRREDIGLSTTLDSSVATRWLPAITP